MTQSTTPQTLDFPAQRIEAAHRQAMLLTGLIGATLVFFAIVVEVLKRTLPPPAPIAGLDTLRIVLFALAGVAIFTATVLKGVMLRRVAATGEARIAQLRTTAVLSAAFAELPAVLGLVLFVVGRRTGDFYILLAVALYMLVRHLPRREAWENYVRGGHAVR
jgi:hypothetical protein